MAVPAWTAREWRPLARDLCAHLLDAQPPVSDASSAPHGAESDDRKRQQRLLLRADKVVTKMYSHRYMDITPQQIKGEVDEIAKKMDIHLLSERAARLKELATGCDYRVVKMLMELAEAPTRASDAHVAVDSTAPLEALQAWNRLLTPSKDVQRAETRALEEAALAAKLEAELLQVAWEDDWWKERQDDDDASDLDDALQDDEDMDDMGRGSGEQCDTIVRGIASRVLAPEEIREGSIDRDGQTTTMEIDEDALTDQLDEGEGDEDDLLLQYFRPATDPVNSVEAGDRTDDQRPNRNGGELFFSFDKPSLLLPLVESVTAHRSISAVQKPREPRRVVREDVLVEGVFYALRGIPSPFFEMQKSPQSYFCGDFSTFNFETSTLVLRGLAVSHLSPMSMASVLDRVAVAASNLQFLRDVAAFFAQAPSDNSRSTTAEGMASGIYRQVKACERFVSETHENMTSANLSVTRHDSINSQVPATTVLPTLLGVLGTFQDMFKVVAWLRSTVTKCIETFQTRTRREITAAELSSQLLSALHQELRLVFIESSESASRERSQWDLYEIFCRLFVGTLTPYLDVMDRVLFERGYDARIQLHHELFFVDLGQDATSPKSAAVESFEDAMSALMPFRVEAGAVPTFLRPLVRLMSAALESRQILNQYLNQHTAPTDILKSTSKRLSEYFTTTFTKTAIPSTSLRGVTASGQSCPLDELLRQAVIQPVQEKCTCLNGVIANLFREKLQFCEHVDIVRSFLLMHQQDVFTDLAQFLIEQIQLDPVGWAKNESLNTALQDSVQRLHVDGLISSDQRDIAARISIRVDIKELEKLRIARHIDVMAVRHLQFKFSSSQPLRVLFSGSIVHKYSTLAVLLLQVKLVELILTNFKQNYRHRLCFLERVHTARIGDIPPANSVLRCRTHGPLRGQLVHLADMLHYTRAVLNYLANQMTGDSWSKVERVIRQSQSIREINEAHEVYLDKMLNAFFVLKKHEGFTRQFMQNFNDIIAYGSRVEDFVRTVERNMGRYFDTIEPADPKKSGQNSTRRDIGTRRRERAPNDEFRALHAKLLRSLKNSEGNYETQLHVITIVLDAMVKNGASPHVNELLLLLTFNGYRAPSRSRMTSSG